MQELVKLLPDGAAVVAVIVVVVLFLKQHEKANITLNDVTKQCHDRIYESQKCFQDQVLVLAEKQYENQKAYQDQIQALIEVNVNVAKETIMALKTLEMSIKEARDQGLFKRAPSRGSAGGPDARKSGN